MDEISLKAIVKALVLPPTGPMLIAMVGLVILRRFPAHPRFPSPH